MFAFRRISYKWTHTYIAFLGLASFTWIMHLKFIHALVGISLWNISSVPLHGWTAVVCPLTCWSCPVTVTLDTPSQYLACMAVGASCPSCLRSAPPIHWPTAASIIFIKHKSSHAVPMLPTLNTPIALGIKVPRILTAPYKMWASSVPPPFFSLFSPAIWNYVQVPEQIIALSFLCSLQGFLPQSGTFSSPLILFPSLLIFTCPLSISLVVTFYRTSSSTPQNEVGTPSWCHSGSVLDL